MRKREIPHNKHIARFTNKRTLRW